MRRVLIATGLQRSGNHAVLDWVASLFADHVFHNNQPHALFADRDRAAALLAAAGPVPCLIVSFEDSRRHSVDPARTLLEDVTPFPEDLAPDAAIHRLSILRDPYNTWASRVAANDRIASGGRGLSSDPSWEMFRRNWLAMAARQAVRPEEVILFNAWAGSARYRRDLCAALGGSYSEATLEQVPRQATGSSFDGLPRPGYGQMLRRLPYYARPAFLRRLVSRPAHYVHRFLTPPRTGKRMKINERWRFLLDRADGAPLFADPAIRAESLRIFGFAVTPEGEVIGAGTARRTG